MPILESGKAPGPEDIGKDELLKALGKEDDETDEKPDEDRPSRSVLFASRQLEER